MNIINHCLNPVEFISSPNFNERPSNTPIDLLVIHNISLPPGEFGNSYIADLFTNRLNIAAHPYFASLKDTTVSAHLVIHRTGTVQQFVPFNKRAWHAGQSQFAGRYNCNDFSIGIELEGTDDVPYTTEQYQQLVTITKLIITAYPEINIDRIVGHCDIAPRRKTDPGKSFDWEAYKRLIKGVGE